MFMILGEDPGKDPQKDPPEDPHERILARIPTKGSSRGSPLFLTKFHFALWYAQNKNSFLSLSTIYHN
jgi:hypothetical protein